jgi:hypothetical protein
MEMTDNKRAADDADREAFEASLNASEPGAFIERNERGYLNPYTQSMFEGWILARAALSSRADGGKGEAVGIIEHNEIDGVYFAPSVHWLKILGKTLYTAPQAECAHKFVPYYEGVQLCEKCKATQAECAPREAQPDSDVIEHKGQNLMQVWFECGRDVFAFYDRIMGAAPTPERADADTAGAKPSQDWIDGYAEGKIVARQLAAASASPERADAGKDAALMSDLYEILMQQNIFTSDESYLRLRCVGVPPSKYEFVRAVKRAILAANKGAT